MDVPDTDPERAVDELFRAIERKANRLDLTEDEADEYRRYAGERWEELQQVLDGEERRTQIRVFRDWFQREEREKQIAAWMAKQNVAATELERDHLRDQIALHIAEGREEEIREYLVDVLQLGFGEAYKRKHRRLYGGYWGHAGAVVVGLLRLIIVLAILNAAESKFETIVFVLLVMTYNAMYSISAANYVMLLGSQLRGEIEFKRLRRLLKEELSRSARQELYSEEKERERKLKRDMVRYYIKAAFDALVWVVAIAALLIAL